jgi:hypothetical protein
MPMVMGPDETFPAVDADDEQAVAASAAMEAAARYRMDRG